MQKIESIINNLLNNYPYIKKIIKRIYQLAMYSVSPKIDYEGNIIRISPNDEYEYFFGYYDKSPWNNNEDYMICLKTKKTNESVAPREKADIILIDINDNYKHIKINETNAWNVQQGSMLQWVGPDFSKRIVFNDYRDNKYCSIIYDTESKEEKIINLPIYDVTRDGRYALSLDFSRLHTVRPGYGYSNIADQTKEINVPDEAAINKINLNTNEITPLITYQDLYNFETRSDMKSAIHSVNHIMINPSGTRFMFLHRWILKGKRYSRLLTMNMDGTELYNLSDDDMVSHSYWKDDETILSYLKKNEIGNGYFLIKDKTDQYEHVLKDLLVDGHPSYSPDGKAIVTDTYPNRSRVQTIYLIENNKTNVLGRVHAPFKYDNDTRCDLHPRWDRRGEKVVFDSVFEGKRALYLIERDKL